MKTTSKQDRQGVRTASDVERKYNIDEQFKKTNEAIPTSTSQLTNDSGLQNKCNVKSTITDTVDKTFIENTKPEFGLSNLKSEVKDELNKISEAFTTAGTASTNASTAQQTANKAIANLLAVLKGETTTIAGVDEKTAFIYGKKIFAPEIHANDVNLYPKTNESAAFQILETNGGGNAVYDSNGNPYYVLLRIEKRTNGGVPVAWFSSPGSCDAMFDFNNVTFNGDVNIEYGVLTFYEFNENTKETRTAKLTIDDLIALKTLINK